MGECMCEVIEGVYMRKVSVVGRVGMCMCGYWKNVGRYLCVLCGSD